MTVREILAIARREAEAAIKEGVALAKMRAAKEELSAARKGKEA